MLSSSLKLALFVAVAVWVSAAAAATPVYTQPPGASGSLLQSSRWEPNGSDYDQHAWDNFRLQAGRAITEVQWRGGYDPAKFGSGGPVLDFTVAIYASIPAGTQPDMLSPPLAKYQTGGNAEQTAAGTVGGTAMYDYRFVLPAPFQAAVGTTYWVSILAAQHGIPDWGLARGTGGDGVYFRKVASQGDAVYQLVPGDAAFTLLGPPSAEHTIFLPVIDK